jgi:hypothetical protein
MALAIGALTDAAEPARHLFLFNFLIDGLETKMLH